MRLKSLASQRTAPTTSDVSRGLRMACCDVVAPTALSSLSPKKSADACVDTMFGATALTRTFVAAHFPGQSAREANHGRLRCRVVDHVGHAVGRGQRGDVDDRAAFAGLHVRRGCPAGQPHALHVHGHGRIPELFLDFVKSRQIEVAPPGGIVHQHVDSPAGLGRAGGHGLKIGSGGDIDFRGQRLGSGILRQRRRFAAIPEIAEHQARAPAGEFHCVGLSQSAGRARNHDGLIVKSHRGFPAPKNEAVMLAFSGMPRPTSGRQTGLPLPSATLMLLRCARGGIEVLMLKRPSGAAFGGAWVFPGGTLDNADRDPSLYRRCLGMGDAHASRALSLPRDGLAYWIAAVRETFEETGVLIAVNGCGQGARAAPGARTALIEGRAALAGLCRRGNWRLPAKRMHYVAHWITPSAARRRFSTRFFVAAAPPGAVARADGREALSVQWFNPAQALKRNIPLAHPTRHFLRILAAMNGLDEALAWARGVDHRSISGHAAGGAANRWKADVLPSHGRSAWPILNEALPAAARGPSVLWRKLRCIQSTMYPPRHSPICPGELVRFAPDIHRLTAFNAGTMTGPGTNTWILGEEELAVLDPGPASRRHIDNLLAKAPGRIRWVLVTHTHADHSPGAALLAGRTGAEIIGPEPPPGERQDQTFKPRTRSARRRGNRAGRSGSAGGSHAGPCLEPLLLVARFARHPVYGRSHHAGFHGRHCAAGWRHERLHGLAAPRA